MNTLSILDRTGDTKITWDASDPKQCAEVRATVEALHAQGYTFFLVSGGPADAVAAGSGSLVVKKLKADAVAAPTPTESPACDTPTLEPGSAPKRLGRPRKNVVAVRPMAGG